MASIRKAIIAENFWVLVLISQSLGFVSYSADAPKSEPATSSGSMISPEDNPEAAQRNFYQVLEDVLSDFEYDLQNNQVPGLKDLSIRNVATSENVPPSFHRHLELLITERVIKNSKATMIQCIPCKTKKATLSGENVIVSSTEQNQEELARIAKKTGIKNFMDIAFSYQPKGMILSLFVTDPETGSVNWSRSYNSETSRAAAIRRGVDYSQIEEQKKQSTYEPGIQYRLITYYLFEPDIGETVGCLGLGFRMVERYDNRMKEVGFELDYLKSSTGVAGGDSNAKSIYSGLNLTLLFVHAWNFFGVVENYNSIRGSLFAGIGGTYASGYLGGLIRSGYEWRLGKHWAASVNLGFRPSGSEFISSTVGTSVSGIEFGVGISAVF